MSVLYVSSIYLFGITFMDSLDGYYYLTRGSYIVFKVTLDALTESQYTKEHLPVLYNNDFDFN
jgi:hypothetical protein